MPVQKVLVLSGLQIFPPESGGQLRSSSLIEALVTRGFEVTAYSMVGRKPDYLAGRPSDTTTIRERLHEYVDRRRSWAAVQFAAYRLRLPPFWITWLLRFHIPRKLKELLASCDAVIADFPFLYPVARHTTKPTALNTHNVEADLCQRGWLRRLVGSIERRAARSVDHVFCCSEADRAHFASLPGVSATSVVPNGIDTRRFAGIGTMRQAQREALGYSDKDRVLFFAASSFGPNVETFEWLLRFVAEHQALLARRNLHFLVVGSVSKRPLERPHLKAVGMVERVEPYFAAADIAFNGALRGSGTNVKMAEFIAAMLPILTSTSGMRGYDLVDGEDCIAFAPENLADVLAGSDAIDDPTRLGAFAASAYEKNKHRIDMNWCVEPLVGWLQAER